MLLVASIDLCVAELRAASVQGIRLAGAILMWNGSLPLMMTTMAVCLAAPVVALRSSASQLSIKKCLHKVFGSLIFGAHVNCNALLCEQFEHTRSHAASNDNFDTLFMKPTRQDSWRMRWRNNLGLAKDLLRYRVS